MSDTRRIWFCKIGVADDAEVPRGGDLPMRFAVEAAFRRVTGRKAKFTFSGWGSMQEELTPNEKEIIGERCN